MAYKQQKCISHSSWGWKSEIRVAAWSGDDLFPVYLHLEEGGANPLGPLWGLIDKVTNAFHGSSILMNESPPKGTTT